MQAGALYSLLRPHMEVHQSRAQMLPVHPFRDGPVVRVRDQQREAEAAFGSMAPGSPNALDAPPWRGGLRTRAMAGSSQTPEELTSTFRFSGSIAWPLFFTCR